MSKYAWNVCYIISILTGIAQGGITRQIGFFNKHNLSGRTCSSDSIIHYDNIVTSIHCMGACTQDKRCKGAIFTSSSKKCSGCTSTDSIVEEEPGSVVYKGVPCIDESSEDPFAPHTIAKHHNYSLVNPVKCVKKILTVRYGDAHGIWHVPTFCPGGTYAAGYNMKVESPQGIDDDSAVNSLSLICVKPNGARFGEVDSGAGPYGSWRSKSTCEKKPGNVFKTFQMKVVNSAGVNIPFLVHDREGVTFIRFQCGLLEDEGGVTTEVVELDLDDEPSGTYGYWSEPCDANQGVCGLAVKIDLGSPGNPFYDDSALNDVVLYCC